VLIRGISVNVRLMADSAARKLAGLATAVVVAHLAMACAGSDPEPAARPSAAGSPSPATGVQLAAPIRQERLHATSRLMTVPLVSYDAQPVRVVSVEMRSGLFEAAPARASGHDLLPGMRADFAVGYGAAVCPAPEGQVEVIAELTGKRTIRLAAPVSETLRRLHRIECRERQLAATLGVDWGTRWRRIPARPGQSERLAGELRLNLKAPGESVTVTGIQGSVLYELTPESAPLAALDEDRREARAPVEVRVRLCHKHGLIEAKKTFVFTLYVAAGRDKAEPMTVEPPPGVQRQIEGLLATCPE
jgi:hypothetical protein